MSNLATENFKSLFGCTPNGVMQHYASKKYSHNVLGNAFRKSSRKGSEKLPCNGFQGDKGSQKRFLALRHVHELSHKLLTKKNNTFINAALF